MAFARVDTTAPSVERIICAPWGLPKDGKTSFALSFPEPLYLMNFDYGYREVMDRVVGKELYVSDYFLPEEFELDAYLPLVLRFREEWNEAVEQAALRGGTVILDTGSEAWRLVGPTMVAETARRAARKSDKNMRTDYGPANILMTSILKRPHQYPNVNAVYIQRSKEIYNAAGAPTGEFQMHGFGDTASIVQLVLNIQSKREIQTKGGQAVTDSKGNPKLISRVFGTIDLCRFGKQFEGMRIENPTYDQLMAVLG